MRIIAIINQKGGCGKTTTSINVSACLARLGQRTLLVDLDPQGHCAVGLAVPEEQVERSIFDVLADASDIPSGKQSKLSEVVWQIASDFDLAPSNLKLAAFEQLFAGRPGRENRLANALAQVKDRYKYAILDCPPSVGLITFNALKACDEVIVPVETGFFSLHGLTKMLQTVELMKEKAGKDVRVRILPTLYDTRTKLAREVLSELRAKFKNQLMESTVNFNTKLKEAASFGQPITEYDPGSRGYKDFVNLARELMGQQPLDVEAAPTEPLSRPMELVQRAKALANLTNLQFGRNLVSVPGGSNKNTDPDPGLELSADDDSSVATLPERRQSPISSSPVSPSPVSSTSSSAMVASAATASMSLLAEIPDIAPILVSNLENTLANVGMNDIHADIAPAPAAPSPAPVARKSSPQPKTTEEKLAEFYGVKRMGSEVLFAAHFDQASEVQIAGDFNNWSPVATPMKVDHRGRWVTSLALGPGRYRYRLVVDGRWITDPNNNYVESNQFGELNNVIEVD
jgi:chromosome partitioning protein